MSTSTCPARSPVRARAALTRYLPPRPARAGASSARDVDRVTASLAARLRAAGVTLPDSTLAALADAVLTDALRLALDWLEPDAAPSPTA
jgi:hypothetical protein